MKDIRFAVMSTLISTGLACGCGGATDAPKLQPVSGSVMYNGKAVAGATVSFFHEKAPQASIGKTDSEGRFFLSMKEPNDGAMAGQNIVTVHKESAQPAAAAQSTSGPPSPSDLAGNMAKMAGTGDPRKKKDTNSELPAKYASRTTTPEKVDVKEGENTFVIQLVD